jgi:predicted alpha/beta superfamily hydrolase
VNTQKLLYHAHEVREHSIESKFVAQTFKIEVFQPLRAAGDSERFPVLYTTDADYFFGGLANLANQLQLVGETPRFIMVGIGYPDTRAAALLRMRDLVSHSIRRHFQEVVELLAASPFVNARDHLPAVTQTTDAEQFLRFIREELMPFIDSRYPTRADDASYWGYSAGGTFGLYTLFTQPDTFKRYVLGSPATSYDGQQFGIELAENFRRSGGRMKARLFMSVGELEEFYGKFDLVSGFYAMAKFLKTVSIEGLDLTSRVFPGETHATAWTCAFSHGLKALFGPAAQVPWWPDFGGR